jgi:hypothetical protein
MQLQFGAGNIFAKPITDAYGNAVAIPTPVRIAGTQEFSLEFSGDLKEFHGSGRYALAVAQGKVKLGGKMKAALINGLTLNTLFFGTGTTGGTMEAVQADGVGALIPATPFQITPTVPSTGTWVGDLGVVGSNGLSFVRVASAPTAGQYSVAAGVYTFALADVATRVYISFRYTYALAAAKRIDLSNLDMGQTPRFQLVYEGTFGGKRALAVLESVVAPKLTMFGAKNDDFSVPELEFSAQTDDSGFSVGYIVTSE